MKYLLDSGILLRLVSPAQPLLQEITSALEILKDRGHTFHCSTQNIAEFWSVALRRTRRIRAYSARNTQTPSSHRASR